jgi:hypothetical protein
MYEKLWEECIAEKLDEAVWRDKNNNIVGTQADAYGQKMQYSLLHTYYLVMVVLNYARSRNPATPAARAHIRRDKSKRPESHST